MVFASNLNVSIKMPSLLCMYNSQNVAEITIAYELVISCGRTYYWLTVSEFWAAHAETAEIAALQSTYRKLNATEADDSDDDESNSDSDHVTCERDRNSNQSNSDDDDEVVSGNSDCEAPASTNPYALLSTDDWSTVILSYSFLKRFPTDWAKHLTF